MDSDIEKRIAEGPIPPRLFCLVLASMALVIAVFVYQDYRNHTAVWYNDGTGETNILDKHFASIPDGKHVFKIEVTSRSYVRSNRDWEQGRENSEDGYKDAFMGNCGLFIRVSQKGDPYITALGLVNNYQFGHEQNIPKIRFEYPNVYRITDEQASKNAPSCWITPGSSRRSIPFFGMDFPQRDPY